MKHSRVRLVLLPTLSDAFDKGIQILDILLQLIGFRNWLIHGSGLRMSRNVF